MANSSAKKNRYNVKHSQRKKEKMVVSTLQFTQQQASNPFLDSCTHLLQQQHPKEEPLLPASPTRSQACFQECRVHACVSRSSFNGSRNWMSKWIHTAPWTQQKHKRNSTTRRIEHHQGSAVSKYGASASVLLGGIAQLLLWKEQIKKSKIIGCLEVSHKLRDSFKHHIIAIIW